jgi:hypothetical protein
MPVLVEPRIFHFLKVFLETPKRSHAIVHYRGDLLPKLQQ